MALLTIADLEAASGVLISDTEQAQWYIDVITSYIQDYTGFVFDLVQDEQQMCRSDRYGQIIFPTLNSVSLVELRDDWSDSYQVLSSGEWASDGISTIYGLEPCATVRCTISYGNETPPTAIVGIATELALASLGLSVSASGPMTQHRVGEVVDVYGVNPQGAVTISSLQAEILSKYSRNTTTWMT